MNNQIFNLIKITALAAILAAGVSAVSAFSGPSSIPSIVSVPVNVSSDAQKKMGGFISELFLKSGAAHGFALTSPAAQGWIIAEDTLVSPWSFSAKTFLPGTTSQMKIGSPDGTGLAQFTDATFPLTIELAGRGTAPASTGRDAIEFLANTNYCNTQTTIRTNTPGVQFWSTKNTDNADLIARQVQLNGGNPAKDKVLISVDTAGNATWAEVKVTNGVISYINYDTVPDVKKGQDICAPVPPPVFHWGFTCRQLDDSNGTYVTGTATKCYNEAGRPVATASCSSLQNPVPAGSGTAYASLPMCSSGSGSGTGSLKMWRCHATNIGNGSWIAYPGPSNQNTCATQSAPASNPATEGQLSCYDGIPPYICAGG